MYARASTYTAHAAADLVRSAKDTEYETILRVTRGLSDSDKRRESNYPKFIEALHLNQRLWSILTADVSTRSNPLPSELKARIFYLGEFVQSYTKRILRENIAADPLLEINLSVLRGLAGKGGSI